MDIDCTVKEGIRIPNTNNLNLQLRYRNEILNRKLCHAYYEKWEKRNSWRNITIQSDKHKKKLGAKENYKHLGILEAKTKMTIKWEESQLYTYFKWQVTWIWLSDVGWLFDFYGISTFVGYLTPNPFYENSYPSNNSVQHKYAVQSERHLHFKPFCLVKQFYC